MGRPENNKVYESMAAQMRSLGYLRTMLQGQGEDEATSQGVQVRQAQQENRHLITTRWLPCLVQGLQGRLSLFIQSEVHESMWVPKNSSARTPTQTT
ncbi:hypothetical protein MRX96_021161 [Rhipicephalus microplus]